ncbi:MAG: D-aminoacylase [Hyphomonadaceae bacterium]|nr:D-aminoacylase [Hyphomonadaceae bacterium]
MHDLVIRHGLILDGTGGPAFEADIAVTGDRIVAIGPNLGPARREIDARGLIVTPGWVDIHTHYDGQATWDPVLAPSSWHGVTTAVMGNCGVGFAPVRPGKEQFLIELMEGVEDIPGSALAEGIDWRWEHFPEYLDALEQMPRAIDVGTHVPHAAVRAYVLGERCNTDYEPTPAEIKEMAALVREGVEAGALGFSTSRTIRHKDVHGVLVPGTRADADEMFAIGHAMKGLPHGVFEMASDDFGEPQEWDWVEALARATGVPITVVAATPSTYDGDAIYNVAAAAEREGLDIRPQIGGRPTGILQGLQSNFNVFMAHPTFVREIAPLPLAQKAAAMRRPDIRTAILAEESKIRSLRSPEYLANMFERLFPLGENPDYEQERASSIAGRAEAAGVPALELLYDLMAADEGLELFYQPFGGYQGYSFEPFRKNITHPNVLVSLSDGGAHCGFIADAGMQTFMLTYWARDRKRGEGFDLPFIVRKLTSDTAAAYGLRDRGLLKPGYLADINVIDFDALRLHRPEALQDLPAGGVRLVQRVDGYRFTIKSGRVTFENGAHTGELPGVVLRGGKGAPLQVPNP